MIFLENFIAVANYFVSSNGCRRGLAVVKKSVRFRLRMECPQTDDASCQWNETRLYANIVQRNGNPDDNESVMSCQCHFLKGSIKR